MILGQRHFTIFQYQEGEHSDASHPSEYRLGFEMFFLAIQLAALGYAGCQKDSDLKAWASAFTRQQLESIFAQGFKRRS